MRLRHEFLIIYLILCNVAVASIANADSFMPALGACLILIASGFGAIRMMLGAEFRD